MILKRTHSQPEGFSDENIEGFFMVARSDAALIISEKLTGSQVRLWLYLMFSNPFADFTPDGEPIYRKIPSPSEISIKLGISRRTIEKDLNVLRNLGLYDYKVTEWHGHNVSAKRAKEESERLKRRHSKGGYLAANTVKQPQESLNNRSNEKINANAANFTEVHNIDRVRDQTFSDNSNFLQTFPEEEAPLSQKEFPDLKSENSEPVVVEVEVIPHQSVSVDNLEYDNLTESEAKNLGNLTKNEYSTTPIDQQTKVAQILGDKLVTTNQLTLRDQNSDDGADEVITTLSKIGEQVKASYEKTGKIPPLEMYREWIQPEMGEIIRLYRKSGLALSSSRTDINPDFAMYVACNWKDKNGKPKDFDAGVNRIVRLESTPVEWGVLAALVTKWQASKKTGDRTVNISRKYEEASKPKSKFHELADKKFYGGAR
jgi:hypothetical protein